MKGSLDDEILNIPLGQMDPLSVTASIIAVLQATNSVVSVCYDYSSAVKKAPWELPKVINELKGLRNVLESLEQLAREAENNDPNVQSNLLTLQSLVDSQSGLLNTCLDEVIALKDKLKPTTAWAPDGSRRRAIMEAVTWPLKEKETLKILDKLARCRSLLSDALAVDQT